MYAFADEPPLPSSHLWSSLQHCGFRRGKGNDIHGRSSELILPPSSSSQRKLTRDTNTYQHPSMLPLYLSQLCDVPSNSRIRPLLTPSILRLQPLNYRSRYTLYFLLLHGVSPFPLSTFPLPFIDILVSDGTPEEHLKFWTPLNPVVLQLSVGTAETQRLPPTVSHLSRQLIGLVSDTWDRSEEVVGTGEGSVLLLEEGDASGERLAFGDRLEKCRQRSSRGRTSYHRLETSLEGEKASLVEWVPRTSFATHLAVPPPLLEGDEVACRFVARA